MKLLTPRDAGRRLGITSSAVARLAREGRLPEIRDSGNRRLFRAKDVESLARRREHKRAATTAA